MSKLTLRIEHGVAATGKGALHLTLRSGVGVAAECKSGLDFKLGAKDAEAIRWYWEDYLDYPAGEAVASAADAERRLQELGEQLFRQSFASQEGARLWSLISPCLHDIRIEISSPSHHDAPEVPWELLRDPETGRWLAAECRGFVRRSPMAPSEPLFRPDRASKLRVLAVICRPARLGEITFRPPFRELVKRFGSKSIEWDILRPPTFGKLTSTLLEAESFGEPYHVLHFEGGALAADLTDQDENASVAQAKRYSHEELKRGTRGFLALDHAQDSTRLRLVDATSLAEAMGEARTPVAVFSNCCELHATSEGAEPTQKRREILDGFHRLAYELGAYGIAAAVESPYCLDPASSAKWMEAFYGELARGAPVSLAARSARRKTLSDSGRSITFDPVHRTDWCEPIVHETTEFAPLALTPINADRTAPDERKPPQLDPLLPSEATQALVRRADLETDLDRMFQSCTSVLLHGPQGIGKTCAASGFASWLGESGGLEGPVIYSSLRLHRSLVSLLDQLAGHFRDALESNGLQWERMHAEDRLDTALYILNQIPVLWIWDGLETINGAEDCGLDEWNEEQRDLLNEFLDAAAETQARLLLLSRDSEDWLGKRVRRKLVGPWDSRERLQLVRSVLTESGASSAALNTWDPLVSFGRGNPLVTRLLVREALHEGLRSHRQLEKLAGRVFETGAALAGADADSDPTTAALSYVLFNGFSDAEQDVLALLHMFRTVVDVPLLQSMADESQSWSLRELSSQMKRLDSAAEESPLDRARDFGLLGMMPDRCYRVEPCAEAPLQSLFERRFPAGARADPGGFLGGPRAASGRMVSAEAATSPKALRTSDLEELERSVYGPSYDGGKGRPTPAGEERTVRAFVGAMGQFGHSMSDALEDGEYGFITRLQWNESNLRQACRLARQRSWWTEVVGPVRGLGALYEGSGRTGVWQELTDELSPDCLDPGTRGPLPGRDNYWRAVIEQRILLAMKQHSYTWASELQKAAVTWDRARVERFADAPADSLNEKQRRALRDLADSMFRMSAIGRSDSQPLYRIEKEAVELAERLGDARRAWDWCYELGANYTEIRGIRDLARAERWLRRGVESLPSTSPERARFLAALGLVAWERFRAARSGERPESELIRHLTDARQYYLRAIEHDEPDDYGQLASHNLQYGHASYSMGDIDRALPHYREAIRYDQLQNNIFGAAKTRFNLAIALRDVGRLGESRRYAVAAFGELRKISGPISEDLLDRARRLVLNLEELIEQKRKKRMRGSKQSSSGERW